MMQPENNNPGSAPSGSLDSRTGSEPASHPGEQPGSLPDTQPVSTSQPGPANKPLFVTCLSIFVGAALLLVGFGLGFVARVNDAVFEHEFGGFGLGRLLLCGAGPPQTKRQSKH